LYCVSSFCYRFLLLQREGGVSFFSFFIIISYILNIFFDIFFTF
jgi:hypothetical protein